SLTDYLCPVNRELDVSGDTLTGQVIVEVSKKTTVKSLTIKAKGKANVLWSESYGKHSVAYWDSDKYFSQTEAIVPKDHDDGVSPCFRPTNSAGL
uniref:Arrestin-like N-terminal domain-containing protein n=1 Tax=Astyanax mexicanus TaxID=7994 RepID=A0A8B9LYB4_ASTMX